MRLEFESNATAFPLVENDTVSESAPSEGEQLLRAGVKAAQEGRRSEAKALLLRVTEVEPENENAWLWLASISEYPEELLVFLNNVLRVNPENARAIEWKKATKSLLAKTLVQRGVDASREDRTNFARQCFEQAIEHDHDNELAWLWLASVAESESEKVKMFERVLSINPENEVASTALRSFRAARVEEILKDAVCEASEGNHQAAVQMLAIVIEENDTLEDAWILKAHLATSFEERAESLLRLRAINPDNEMARACLSSWRTLVESSVPRHERAASDETAFTPDEPEMMPVATGCEPIGIGYNNGAANEPESPAFAFRDEFALPDVPTQDLHSIPGFSYQPTDESSYLSSDNAPAFDQPADDLAAEIEAEESEMSEAFSAWFDSRLDGPEDDGKVAGADEESWTITEPAECEADEAEEILEVMTEMDAEPQSVPSIESDEEWKNTSPDVFVGYSPKAPEREYETALEPVTPTPITVASPSESLVERNDRESAVVEENRPEPAFETESECSVASAEDPSLGSDEPTRSELSLCPFCNAENEKQAFSCSSCHAALGLSDLEAIFSPNGVNEEIVAGAVASFEREHESYGLNAEQLASLGIGHINLKNFRQGYLYLQEAVQANPNNVVLDAQLNAFMIRLDEIEKQQTAQESMAKNRKILVVDDSPTVRKLISSKLEKCGHEVVCAVDGLDALEKLNGLNPDLILLDITMPRMDGYQVCKLIRGNESMKDVPVVMISGKDGFFDKVRGRMAGTTDYITKPFGPETLMKTVENYLA